MKAFNCVILAAMFVAPTVFAQTFDITAHRGNHVDYSENTIEALTTIISKGATSVEFDVIALEDGSLVLNHDFEVTPEVFTNLTETKDLRDMDLAEVRTLRHKRDGLPISTLEEFFQAVQARPEMKNVTLHLEIKQESKASHLKDFFAQDIAALIKRYHMESQIIVRSFDWDMVELLKKEAPEVRRALLIGRITNRSYWRFYTQSYQDIVDRYQPVLVAPHQSLVTKRMVQKWNSFGIGVNPYTVNSVADVNKFIAMGVSGVTTDIPQQIVDECLSIPACKKYFRP